jgi:hypothetical protein
MLMIKKRKIGNCHQATFLALPVTIELTVVGTPHSALAPHVSYCQISF